MATLSESFECPPGFEEEEILGQLCLEDIDDDSELWLIRMPSDIKLSSIDKKKIILSDVSNSCTVTTEDGKVLECFAEDCEIPTLRAVLPQKNDKKLNEVRKVFKGSILVTEGLCQNDEAPIKTEITDEPENNLIDSTPTSKKKSKKSKTLDEPENGDYMDVSHSKKRSSKKRSNVEERYSVDTLIKTEP